MNKTNFTEEYLGQFKEVLGSLDFGDFESIINILIKAYQENKQVFIIGNGGSASLASHFACDLGKGTVQNFSDDGEKRFKAISLTSNTALMTAYSNDMGYEHVFSQQLKNMIAEGDIVIAISASGNSENVVTAVNFAKKSKAITIGLIGFSGGKLKDIVDYKLWVNSNDYGIVESVHTVFEHMICSAIKERILKISA